MNEQKKLYPERDPAEFVDYYMRHVEAMTSEELFGKGDIAVQLAWRDREIDQLRQRVAEVESELARLADVEHRAKEYMGVAADDRGYNSAYWAARTMKHLRDWRTGAEQAKHDHCPSCGQPQAGELPPRCAAARTLGNETLVEIALQAAGRTSMIDSEIHRSRYSECRTELLRRLAGWGTVDDAMVRRALDGQDAYWDDDAIYVTCERCDGKGHHGGFGEGGHDQDWCETCGGPGSINIGTEIGAMRAALVAALGAK